MTCLSSVPASLKLFLMLLNGTQNKEIIRNFTSHIIVHILFGIWQPFLVFTGYIVTHLYRDILSREIFIRGTYVQHAWKLYLNEACSMTHSEVLFHLVLLSHS